MDYPVFEGVFVDAIEEEKEKLVEDIQAYEPSGEVVKTKLKTDQKVLARVTDGIYRFPGSAIRELISNAYDADAENVFIDTDVPRFESMTIRDDGNGMSIETLVNMLSHIGGSAKRNNKGKRLEVTDDEDSSLSRNKKRKLIGKIGIGLFSVAQLTRDFEIITKQSGSEYYLHARINLHNYSEEYLNSLEQSNERGASFETGSVSIWTEKTSNIDAHGTDIILNNIKKSARDQLKSLDIWGQEKAETDVDPSIAVDDILNSSKLDRPYYHVGFSSYKDGYESYDEKEEKEPSLPWDSITPLDEKFRILYEGMLSLTKKTSNPKLSNSLDNYLNMIWNLSLSIPLDYIDRHPFLYSKNEIEDVYAISNKLKGQVSEILPQPEESFSRFCKLETRTESVGFNVVIDGIKLYRPIKFTDLPESDAVVKKPILFIGSYQQKFAGLDPFDSGGEIAFDAYLLWSPKVIPKEHNGVLIRLHNASGILFDETFMKHQVAEHTIKSQITAEIYVRKGLDSALNIDRESFNISHPHYQVIMTWLHQAIRQVVNKYKLIKKSKLLERSEHSVQIFNDGLLQITQEAMKKTGREDDVAPSLYLVDSDRAYSHRRGEKRLSDIPVESIVFDRERFKQLAGGDASKKSRSVEAKIEVIIQLLNSYGLLDNLSAESQSSLIEDIIKVLSFEE
jgi:hypothetical protein